MQSGHEFFFTDVLQTSSLNLFYLGKIRLPQGPFLEDLSFHVRSMIHLKLIFVYGLRQVYLFPHIDILLSQYHLLKDHLSPIELQCLIIVIQEIGYVSVSFWAPYSALFDYDYAILHCLTYCRFMKTLDIWQLKSSIFVLFFKIALPISCPLNAHVNFKISVPIPPEIPRGILIRFALNIQINLGRIDISILLCWPVNQ